MDVTSLFLVIHSVKNKNVENLIFHFPSTFGRLAFGKVQGQETELLTSVERVVTAGKPLVMSRYSCRYAHTCLLVHMLTSETFPRHSQ